MVQIPPPATQPRDKRLPGVRSGAKCKHQTGSGLYCAYHPATARLTLSGVFVNRPLRSVGEFGYAYNLLDAINNRNGMPVISLILKTRTDSTNQPRPRSP